MSWHFPNRAKGWIEVDEDLERHRQGGYDLIRNHYATRFQDAWQVAETLADRPAETRAIKP